MEAVAAPSEEPVARGSSVTVVVLVDVLVAVVVFVLVTVLVVVVGFVLVTVLVVVVVFVLVTVLVVVVAVVGLDEVVGFSGFGASLLAMVTLSMTYGVSAS